MKDFVVDWRRENSMDISYGASTYRKQSFSHPLPHLLPHPIT